MSQHIRLTAFASHSNVVSSVAGSVLDGTITRTVVAVGCAMPSMLDDVTVGAADDPPNSPLCDAVSEESSVGEADGMEIRNGDDGNELDASAVVAGVGLGRKVRGK